MSKLYQLSSGSEASLTTDQAEDELASAGGVALKIARHDALAGAGGWGGENAVTQMLAGAHADSANDLEGLLKEQNLLDAAGQPIGKLKEITDDSSSPSLPSGENPEST